MKLATFRSSSTKRIRMANSHHYIRGGAVYLPAFRRRGAPGILLQIIANDLPALHNEFYALQFGDVTQRVSCHRNDVRELSFFDRANTILPSHHFCRDSGGCLNGLSRLHPLFDAKPELPPPHPSRKRSAPTTPQNSPS